jgi:hypothetical protein
MRIMVTFSDPEGYLDVDELGQIMESFTMTSEDLTSQGTFDSRFWTMATGEDCNQCLACAVGGQIWVERETGIQGL